MANASFGVNIIPKNNAVTIGNSNSPWTIVSPAMTGTPTAPTAAAGTNTTQVATTAFVKSAVDAASTSVLFTTLGFSIATTDWSQTSPYTYTFSDSAIGDNTTVDVYFDLYDGGAGFPDLSWAKTQNGIGPDIKWEKVSGGIQFTVRVVPSDTITGTIRVIGVANGSRMVEVADTTVPISKGGTGAANAAGAKSNLGLNDVENKSSATIRSEITKANVTTALGVSSDMSFDVASDSQIDALFT